jgi:hypothetical protein
MYWSRKFSTNHLVSLTGGLGTPLALLFPIAHSFSPTVVIMYWSKFTLVFALSFITAIFDGCGDDDEKKNPKSNTESTKSDVGSLCVYFLSSIYSFF